MGGRVVHWSKQVLVQVLLLEVVHPQIHHFESWATGHGQIRNVRNAQCIADVYSMGLDASLSCRRLAAELFLMHYAMA